MQAAEATNRSAEKRVAEMATQEYVIRLTLQTAEVTNTLALFARLHDKSKVDRNILIASRSLRVEEVDLLAF
jgi:hypothetical protein